MKKAELLKLVIAGLGGHLALLEKAARASHAEATHESSKPENKYDTRGLEAAYLAGGQARQIREVLASIEAYEKMVVKDFAPDEPIDLGALVELQMDGNRNFYFIGPKSGGLEILHQKQEIVVLTPPSPLGQMLMGRKSGDTWTAEVSGSKMKYKIVSVK